MLRMLKSQGSRDQIPESGLPVSTNRCYGLAFGRLKQSYTYSVTVDDCGDSVSLVKECHQAAGLIPKNPSTQDSCGVFGL